MNIADLVRVRIQPTVVRLTHLESADAAWISENYFVTEAVSGYLATLRNLFAGDSGRGIFLIGHYGSGKSHFLAYLAQQLASGAFVERPVAVRAISLLNYAADQSLASIVLRELELDETVADRRASFAVLAERYPDGLLLIIDELSEFLRAKSPPPRFNEDIRFLQFMGEWAQQRPLWVLASLQEQIEHTGEMEYDLFRKIKDRYPVRMILSPTHVVDLIASRILVKQEGYDAAVSRLIEQLKEAFPGSPLDFSDLAGIYPIHPMTLTLLEEVRDRFSQERGIVGFTMGELGGDAALGKPPFLDQPWGSLLTPEKIVDHFEDLFKVQPEFLALAQKVLPYYRRHLVDLFPKQGRRILADRLLKLLMLVHLSPARESLSAEEAAWWLLYKVSSIDPDKNLTVIRDILTLMAERGAYVRADGGHFAIDLKEDGAQTLDHLIERALEEVLQPDATLLEELVPHLEKAAFNPFLLDRDRWQKHTVHWHFHERAFQVWFGGGAPILEQGIGLQIGMPWGEPAEGRGCYRLIPRQLAPGVELRELAALARIARRPLPKQILDKVSERIAARAALFGSQLREAFLQARLVDPRGDELRSPAGGPERDVKNWLFKFADFIFRREYPQFENFAPAHGPLPQEAYRQFMAFALEHDLGHDDAPEYVKLIREAYLVPMKLMERRGMLYRISSKLDKHDLVKAIRPLLQHQPSPKRIYQHLATPVYGLVADQVHLLLLVLMIQGDIDILKGRSSCRDLYETFPTPLAYDRIVQGRGLTANELHDLNILCEGFHLPVPEDSNVLAQRRLALQLRRYGQKERDQLGAFQASLTANGEAKDLAERIGAHLDIWKALEKGENEIQGLHHFLFQVASPRRFLETHAELASLPARLERLMGETRRFRHLLDHPVLKQSGDPALTLALEHLGSAPDLSEPDALEEWLAAATQVYASFKQGYRQGHERYWREINEAPIWNYRPPAIALSRHLALEARLGELTKRRDHLRAQVCRGLANLDFQPQCHCAFDGKETPLAEELGALERLVEEIETRLTDFFQQEKVRSKVAEWVDKGMESNERTLAYLAESRPYPRVADLALFDKHLAGLELYRQVDAAAVVSLLCERVWERDDLMRALDDLLRRQGPRLVFTEVAETGRTDLADWCLEAALRLGIDLPKGLSARERRGHAGSIKAEWVTAGSLCRLDRLGLDEASQARILKMVLDGQIPLPDQVPEGPVAAAAHLMHPPDASTARDLAHWSTLLYRHHELLATLDRKAWLRHLDELARAEPAPMPPPLTDLLAERRDDQWLIIDCLGLPLLEMVLARLALFFPDWQAGEVCFGTVSAKTDTASFFKELGATGINKPFLKLNAVDALIHEFQGPFSDLEKLAATELEVACRRLEEFDPARPLSLFADHGFRLDVGGRGYSHGGDSMLERIVPLIQLVPYR